MAYKDRRMRERDLFPEFDFLSAFIAFFFGPGWGTEQLELKPIPVKTRQRR